MQVAGLTVKKRKCQFGMAECLYLGHLVGSGNVCPEDMRVRAVRGVWDPKDQDSSPILLGDNGLLQKVYSPVCVVGNTVDRPHS